MWDISHPWKVYAQKEAGGTEGEKGEILTSCTQVHSHTLTYSDMFTRSHTPSTVVIRIMFTRRNTTIVISLQVDQYIVTVDTTNTSQIFTVVFGESLSRQVFPDVTSIRLRSVSSREMQRPTRACGMCSPLRRAHSLVCASRPLARTYTRALYVRLYACMYARAHVHVFAHSHLCSRAHAPTHTRTRAHTYTYTRSHPAHAHPRVCENTHTWTS